MATWQTLLDSGRVRALAVTSAARSPFVPNLPTTAEAGFPDYVVDFGWGLLGPTGTPADVVRRLNAALNASLAEPDTRQFLARFGAQPAPTTPEEYGRIMTAEVTRWTRIIKEANIRFE